MPMTKGETSLSLPLWMLLKTSSKPRCCLLKTWSAPTKEQEQILALTVQVHQLHIAKVAPKKDKGAPNGLGRRSFPRRENLSLRLWMAKTTIWHVSIIPTNGFATPLPNPVRTLPTMASPRMPLPNNASRKPALLLLLFWLKRMRRRRNLMRNLIATEIVAREDFIPSSFIFSVGHPSRSSFHSSPSSFLYGPGNWLLSTSMPKLCYRLGISFIS
jgi:hypothetical protein